MLIPNLTRPKIFKSKSCLAQKHFHSKSWFLENFFSSKSCFLKLHARREICAFYGVNWIRTWSFVWKIFFKICFLKLYFSSKSSFLKKSFYSKSCFFKKIFFLKIWRVGKFLIQNLTRCFFFQSKIGRVVKLWNQNLTRCENFVSKSDALELFNSKSDKYFYSTSDYHFVFQVLTERWYLLWTLIPNLFSTGDLKDNSCYRFSRQLYKWNMAQGNSSLNVWGIALWQHTYFTLGTERSLWSIKCSRSAVFLKKNTFVKTNGNAL